MSTELARDSGGLGLNSQLRDQIQTTARNEPEMGFVSSMTKRDNGMRSLLFIEASRFPL